MENTDNSDLNKQSINDLKKQTEIQKNIIIKWDKLNSLRNRDSSNKYYTQNENKSITENLFFQSKANSNFVFISNLKI